jgi:hypothetical protein
MVFAVALFISFVVALSFGEINQKISVNAIVVFLFTLLVNLSWVLIFDKKIESLPTTEIINAQTGISMVGYFSDSTTFNIVPNHITEIKRIYPRWGSINGVKFEY